MKPILYLRELSLNRNVGMFSFMVQRLTGLALVLYLILHIYTLSAIASGPESFDHSLGKYENLLGHVLEYLLLLCVAVHLLNGLRILVVDFLSLTQRHARLLAYAVAAGVFVAAVGLFYMLPELWH